MARELNFENMTQEEMQMLDALRNVSNRGQRGIGTSGLSGQDVLTAEEMIADAPTNLETGFGPAEYNPQQRYGLRYQQRAGVDKDGPSQFDQLSQNVATGQALDLQQPYTPSYTPSFIRGREGSGGDAGMGGYGDARDSTAYGDMSLGAQTAQDMTPGSIGMDIATSMLGPAMEMGLSGALMGPSMGFSSTDAGIEGFGMGLKSAMTSPMGWAKALDKAIGAAYGQSQLASAIDNMGATRADVDAAKDLTGVTGVDGFLGRFGPATASYAQTAVDPAALAVANELDKFDTAPVSTRFGRGIAGMLGFGPGPVGDDSDKGLQDASNRDKERDLASRTAMANQLSSPTDIYGGLRSMQEMQSALERAAAQSHAEQAGINSAMNNAFGFRSEAGADMGGMVGNLDASFSGWGDMFGSIGGMFSGNPGQGGMGGIGNMGPGGGGEGSSGGNSGGSGDGRGQGGDRGGGRSDGGGGYR